MIISSYKRKHNNSVFLTAMQFKKNVRCADRKLNLWRKCMAYTKPQVVAQNATEGSYASGCPTHSKNHGGSTCASCEITH